MSPLQIEFEKKLHGFGLSYTVNWDDLYTISSQSGGGNHIIVRLILSLPTIKQVDGSKNGNEVQAIGLFKFNFLASRPEPDIFAFVFQNPVKNKVEFLIIPTQEFLRRRIKMHPGSVCLKSSEMVIWLMQDGHVYDTTNMSVEAEWYYLTKGVQGRMADGTAMDFTKYLNCWQKIFE